MKWRSRSRNRRCSNTPSSRTRSAGIAVGASAAPSIVRQGLNHSLPAPSAPMRACVPSETTRTAFVPNSAGICAWYVPSWLKADQIVAASSAGFLSSITATGRPLRNRTTSGRRSWPPSTTVNWLTATQSLALGSLEVDDAGLGAGDRAVGAAVLHRHAVDEHPVQRPVPLEQRRQRRAGQLAERLLDRLGRQARVQAGERAPEPALEDDVAVPGVGPLRAGVPDGDLGAVGDRPAEPVEPRRAPPPRRSTR